VLALVVTREGFPLAHYTLAGNTQDVETVEKIVTAIEKRFGKSHRVWVMDRGMIGEDNLKFLRKSGRRYLIGTRRSELKQFHEELSAGDWHSLREELEVKPVRRGKIAYLLVRSSERRKKERAMRRRQLIGLHHALVSLRTLPAGRAAGDDHRGWRATTPSIMEVEDGSDPLRDAPRRSLPSPEQLSPMVAGRILGNLHAVDRRGKSLPSPQEHLAASADMASV
jgi:hypothetical protein